MTRRSTGFLLGVGVLVIVLVVLAIWVLTSSPVSGPQSLPQPNGYDDFVAAGQKLTPGDFRYDTVDLKELKTHLESQAGALALLRTGLGRESVVPLDTIGSQTHLDQLALFKQLCRVLVGESRLAQTEGRNGEAVERLLEVVRFGHECSRGGPMIQAMVGLAIEKQGVGGLEQLLPTLDAAACTNAVRILETIEQRREPVDVVLRNELAWVKETHGRAALYFRFLTQGSVRKAEHRFAALHRTAQGRFRALLVGLAARAWELEHGSPPRSASDLVPSYLRNFPVDPATGKPMSLPR